ncbi:uncharacterized protein [Rhodnius prolixus]|uniref:uncharacterized protein n=1 Tax=Rhodnius prolixus TaxID=13249 RepID=UPI003D18A512
MMEALLLMLLLIGQWRVTMATSDVIEVRNELRLLENDINTFIVNVERDFPTPTVTSEYDIPTAIFVHHWKGINKKKLHELQDDVTKLTQDLTSNDENVDGIKVRISAMEKQLEDLKRLFDNRNREVKEMLEKLRSFFLLKNKSVLQQLAKILKLDEIEFLEAIKHKYYKFAAVKFITLKNESKATELIRKVYRQLDNVDCMLNFAENLNNLNKTLLVYRTLYEAVKGCDLIGICKL